jgi:hypothetical protein
MRGDHPIKLSRATSKRKPRMAIPMKVTAKKTYRMTPNASYSSQNSALHRLTILPDTAAPPCSSGFADDFI